MTREHVDGPWYAARMIYTPIDLIRDMLEVYLVEMQGEYPCAQSIRNAEEASGQTTVRTDLMHQPRPGAAGPVRNLMRVGRRRMLSVILGRYVD